MKNNEQTLDEIIFENRNKMYGAYMLRKKYSKNLNKAILISVLIFLSVISIPLIASYFNEEYDVNNGLVAPEYIIDNVTNKIIEKLPELPKKMPEKTPTYQPPVVTNNEEEVSGELSELAEGATNGEIPIENSDLVIKPEDDTKKTVIVEPDDNSAPVYVEEMPEFPGGDEARIKFFSKNMIYPVIAKQTGIQGNVYLTFIVEKDGSISNIKILRGIGGGCDDEAVRVVKEMPKWKPGRQNGENVRVRCNMPISFVLL